MDELTKGRPRFEEQLEEVNQRLMDPQVMKDPTQLKELGRERARLQSILDAMDRHEEAARALGEARQIVHDGRDEELSALALEEMPDLEAAADRAAEELKRRLIPRDPADDHSAMVEIRAGTGGDEAALFAADIFRMYSRYAERSRFRLELMTSHPTEIGGFKEVVFTLEGDGAYGVFKFESGVHRVQRVPETESSGRIHTSAVSVAVFPEAEDVDIKVNPEDLKVDVYRSSGPGGQSVNTTDSAVRIKHLPTGIVVQCQDERSQLKNKAKAMKVLRAKLLDRARSEQEQKMADARRSMVSTGDRSAKIRTYNFPQGRVTDHRINLTLYNLGAILEGEIDPLFEKLQVAEAERLLEASREG
ncbi:MAG: peptide chain release factor 1 [Candidatus Eisenbacteria bacterium]|nr:peptide chain release factor 1 [Candidatus Eisenbacteria bacterium]